MKYWNTKHVLVDINVHDVQTILDSHSDEGWELVSAAPDGEYYDLFFKRPDIQRELEERIKKMAFRYEIKLKAHEEMKKMAESHTQTT